MADAAKRQRRAGDDARGQRRANVGRRRPDCRRMSAARRGREPWRRLRALVRRLLPPCRAGHTRRSAGSQPDWCRRAARSPAGCASSAASRRTNASPASCPRAPPCARRVDRDRGQVLVVTGIAARAAAECRPGRLQLATERATASFAGYGAVVRTGAGAGGDARPPARRSSSDVGVSPRVNAQSSAVRPASSFALTSTPAASRCSMTGIDGASSPAASINAVQPRPPVFLGSTPPSPARAWRRVLLRVRRRNRSVSTA